MKRNDVTDVYVCGLCTDICVGNGKNKIMMIINVNVSASPASTVFDAQDLGYRVILVEDACKGINPEKVEETIQRIKENNGLVINSKEVTMF